MISFLKGLFSKDPIKQLLRERDHFYVKAVNFQRNGDLRSYAEVMARIEELEKQYSELMLENEE